MNSPLKVVIIGAGFAGLELAQQLASRALRPRFEVVSIDRQNHHTFQPLLHQVATAELEPSQVTYPIRAAIRQAPNVRFVWAEVTNISTEQRWVETTVGRFCYDFLAIATGSQPQLATVPGVREYAFALKTVSDAVAIQRQILRCCEHASQKTGETAPAGELTVAIAGGGPTGIELAGAMAEWLRHSLVKDYKLDCQHIHLVLLHSGDRLLPGFHPRLQRYTLRYLQKVGVEVRLQARVSQVSAQGVRLTDGQFLPAQTVIWTAGVRGNLPLSSSQAASRLSVGPTLQWAEDARTYVLGDAAARQPTPLPMLAAVAVQQGRAVANNLRRQAQGKHPLPFRYQPKGKMVILGRHAAVIQVGRLTLAGIVAWGLWLLCHVLLLRGIRQRLLTLLHWSLNYCCHERGSQILLEVPSAEQSFASFDGRGRVGAQRSV
ncbi:MAG: NAD(P)/FAD-dependent oxidoreductase [Cyanobacteria bacterium J06641_5]